MELRMILGFVAGATCFAGLQPAVPEVPRRAESWMPEQLSRSRAAADIDKVIDDFHDAASKSDATRYFAHFARDFVFLGTDATERWTREEFIAFATPYFAQGKGWTYHPRDRQILLGPHVEGDPDQPGAGVRVAWFDELLDNDKLGVCRGSGVCILEDGRWKVAQYNLSIPVPNDLAAPVCKMIAESGLPGTRPAK